MLAMVTGLAVKVPALRALTSASRRLCSANSVARIGIRMNHQKRLHKVLLRFTISPPTFSIPRHLSLNVSQRPLACSQRHPELARHLQQFPVGGHAFFCAFLLLMIGTYSVTNGNLPRSQGPDSRLSTVTVWFCQNSTGRWIQKRRQSDPFALTSV